VTAAQNAQLHVSSMVRLGLLPNLRVAAVPCTDCGKRATCYDHREYARPEVVQPVCNGCNRKRGPASDWRKWKSMRKPTNLKRSRVIGIRFTKDQRKLAESAATEEGRNLSDWIRRVVIAEADSVIARALRKEDA
jgi:hypothetical protein